MPDNLVKPIIIHFFTYISYKMLVCCDDVPIHKVRIDIDFNFELKILIKNKVAACPPLPSSNVLY